MYYLDVLIASRFFAKGRISAQMQACAFLASFELCLATAVCSQLERDFPDHFPDDPYDTEMIYDATLYALAWQRAVPLVELPREVHDTFHASANDARTVPATAANSSHVSAHPKILFAHAVRPSLCDVYTHMGVHRASHASAARGSDAFYASPSDARTAAAPAAINLRVSVHPIAPFTCTIRPSHRGAYTCVAVRRISCASAARCAAESCPGSKQPPNQFRSCRR